MKHRESYKELDFKNRVAVITCLLAFGLGWSLTIVGFIVPPLGDVHAESHQERNKRNKERFEITRGK